MDNLILKHNLLFILYVCLHVSSKVYSLVGQHSLRMLQTYSHYVIAKTDKDDGNTWTEMILTLSQSSFTYSTVVLSFSKKRKVLPKRYQKGVYKGVNILTSSTQVLYLSRRGAFKTQSNILMMLLRK